MSLTPGTRLGPYEITAQLGVGGMGEVYRATDTNLKRQVAIKVLPASVAADADRLARFQREAEVLAALNHPNIAAIHGLEKTPEFTALVMELVEGEDLSQRIARGAIPVDEALPIARQIAEALEAAHEQGIVHRDLKPANIKIRADGTVKVLDFGLAKAMEPTGAAAVNVSQLPTITTPAMTQAGMILGTAAYMSPEQARGKTVDKRADIWAFGAVLYEMLTGTRAFAGDDVQETFVAIMRDEPDFQAMPPDTPAAVRQVLRLCLKKDPRERLQAIGDARLAMQGAFESEHPHRGEAAAPPRALRWWQRPMVAAVVLASVAAASSLVGWRAAYEAPSSTPRVAQFEITLGEAAALAPAGSDHDLAITPDGTHVIYRGSREGRSFLAVRAISELTGRPLQGLSDSVYAPFTSPDGAWVGFSDEGSGTLNRVSILGGPAIRICSTGAGSAGIAGASWGDDGNVIFGTGTSGGLKRVASSGGQPEELTKLAPGETQHAWPETLPGSRAVLFTILTGGVENSQIAVLDLQTRQRKVVVPGGSYPRFSPTGHIVYGVDGTLRAVPFDLSRLEVTGPPVPVLDGVITKESGAADFALARDGTLVYEGGRSFTLQRTLAWVDRAGREEPLPAPARAYLAARLSPDGRRIALDVRDQGGDIWTWDVVGRTLTRLTLDPAVDRAPVWTPDGRRIVFASQRGAGAFNLFWQAADGTGTAERLTESPNSQDTSAITPDGTRIIIVEGGPTGRDLMLMSLQPPRRAEPLVRTTFDERNAEISPNGRWVAYESGESGRTEVYVRPFPGVNGGRWQVSTAGGRMPLWSRDGRELFYALSAASGAVMGVHIDEASSWNNTTPAQVIQSGYYQTTQGNPRTFDISPDGRRFLMIKPGVSETQDQDHLVLVQNWAEELKRLAPTN